MKMNTALSLGLSTINANGDNQLELLSRSANQLAYNMHSLASSSFGMTLVWNILAAGMV